MKHYQISGGTHVSSNGFVNYFGGASGERLHATLERVFEEYPGSVVLNGKDDWYASQCHRPEAFAPIFGITPLATFHTGTSGLTNSGIVVSREDFEKIEREFPSKTFTQINKPEVTGRQLRDCVRVYEGPA